MSVMCRHVAGTGLVFFDKQAGRQRVSTPDKARKQTNQQAFLGWKCESKKPKKQQTKQRSQFGKLTLRCRRRLDS